MRPIDIQPTGQVRHTEKVSPIEVSRPTTPLANDQQDVSVVRQSQYSAGDPTVDHERVKEIRRALAEGKYPLIPAQIADAMIAAKISLGTSA